MGHITVEQRYTISVMLKKQVKPKVIADTIGKDKSVISREIKRNCDQRSGEYRFDLAQKKCNLRHANKAKHIRFTEQVQTHVIKELENKLSPEQISGQAKLLGIACVSCESIYQFVWNDKAAHGKLHKHLRNKGRRYRKRGAHKDKRGIIPNRIDISLRPKIVEKKIRFGDLEIDTIIGKNHKKALLTITDRAIGYGIIRKLDSKDTDRVAKKTIQALTPFSKYVHTITSDNGLEFSAHEKISKKLEIDYYFARPYCSWERGANENYNRLVRQYFPKGTDFTKVTVGDIKKVQNAINNRPRKRLDYISPKQMLEKLNIFEKVAFIT